MSKYYYFKNKEYQLFRRQKLKIKKRQYFCGGNFDGWGRCTSTMPIEIKIIATRSKKVEVKIKKQYWQRFLTY